MQSNILANTKLVKEIAAKFGFFSCGIAKADFLNTEAPRLESWLKNGYSGEMGYMSNNFDMRLDPRLLVPGAKSVISLLYNYHNPRKLQESSPKISQYAYGTDYHFVIKAKLKAMFKELSDAIGNIEGRVFVDSAPILEKAWAEKSGLGWRGKNTNLITKNAGSYFFLAEIICDLELMPDLPHLDFCGTCTRCIDACPTNAITPYQVDGSKCISYFTIELKSEIPKGMEADFGNWAFGCDICMDVCPWNRFAKPNTEPAFMPNTALLNMQKKDWEEITEEIFLNIFRNSAVKRTGFKGLKRNLKYIGLQIKEN